MKTEAPSSPEDKIVLEGIVAYGYHGVHAAERQLGQPFVVDLEVIADLAAAGRSDDLKQTIDYSLLHKLVVSIISGPPRNLIESLAERIASAVLDQFPVEAVRVRVRKPHAPLAGVVDSVAVEVVRRRL